MSVSTKEQKKWVGNVRPNNVTQDLYRGIHDCLSAVRRRRIKALHNGLDEPRQIRIKHQRFLLARSAPVPTIHAQSYLLNEIRDKLHNALLPLHRTRVRNVHRKGRHEQWRIARGDLEHCSTSLDPFPFTRRGQVEECTKCIDRVDIVLPDVEP